MTKNAIFLFGLFLYALSIVSCAPSDDDAKNALAGHWFILYPDHKLTTRHQREVYARYQDSVVGLYGLKLVTLAADGRFWEMDSLQKPTGKWQLQDSSLRIAEGGKGFNPFKAVNNGKEDDELTLTQYLLLEEETITLQWHWKKISTDSAAARLFLPEANAWRKRPTALETGDAVKKRLMAALNYYGDYFALVADESSYFSYTRVPLPLRYYQHAIGLRTEMQDAFVNLFYNRQQAGEAYALLAKSLDGLQGHFERDKNLAMEYAKFLKKMAHWLE